MLVLVFVTAVVVVVLVLVLVLVLIFADFVVVVVLIHSLYAAVHDILAKPTAYYRRIVCDRCFYCNLSSNCTV